MRKYFIGLKIDEFYTIHIIEDEYEEKEMVHQDLINGFTMCLDYLGFEQI
jgi:hypothetical protein